MAIQSGDRLGPYEIVAAIGAGGMGEVYRARDSKLGRDVALKILPHPFAHDAERMARFEREAKFLASFNPSNMASIYGFEDSGNARALDAVLVRVFQRFAHLPRNQQSIIHGKRALLDAVGERGAFDQLHHAFHHRPQLAGGPQKVIA